MEVTPSRIMDRLSRSDSNTLKNLKSRLPKRIPPQNISRQSMNEKSLFTNHQRNFNQELTDDEEDEGEEETPELQENYSSRGAGLCGVCHLTVGRLAPRGNSIGFEKPFCCSQGHLLCHRCVQRLAIQSDAGCVLCGSEHSSQASSDCSLDNDNYQEPRYPTNEEQGTNSWQKASYVERPPVPSFRTSKYVANLHRTDSYTDWDTTQANGDDLNVHERSYCSIIRKNEDIRTDSEMKINGQMSVECSRRPIRCPRLDCSMNIAFSALTHHFLFDHPEVPILSVEPGVKSTLIVSFSGLSCDSSRCLAVLLVSGKLSSSAARLFNGSQIHPKYRNRLPLPVLAARLHCSNCYTGGEGHGQGDIIIAWVAGLDIASVGDLRCSIQAVDSLDGDGVRSLTYTGPINSLRTAQRPREVFLAGDCVILHEGLLHQLTSDCSTLNVNVIVH